MYLSRARVAVAAAVTVAAVGAVLVESAGAVPSSGSPWRSETMHVIFTHEHCQLQRVPKGKKPAFGDGDICRYDILNTARRKIGHAGFVCGLISGEEGVCDGTMVLPGGTLAIAGDLVDGHQIAISGGTGRYEGAVGQWSYTSGIPKVTVTLLLPRR